MLSLPQQQLRQELKLQIVTLNQAADLRLFTGVPGFATNKHVPVKCCKGFKMMPVFLESANLMAENYTYSRKMAPSRFIYLIYSNVKRTAVPFSVKFPCF